MKKLNPDQSVQYFGLFLQNYSNPAALLIFQLWKHANKLNSVHAKQHSYSEHVSLLTLASSVLTELLAWPSIVSVPVGFLM